MASFSVPCPKASVLSGASQPNSKQSVQSHRHRSISFQSDFKSKPALLAGSSTALLSYQGSRRNQPGIFKLSAQLNEVGIENSNSAPVSKTKSEDPAKINAIPDASSISAFMTQVAELVELVDSRDIMELQLKQLDCELIIRKKEALAPPPNAAPVYMMQSPSAPTSYSPPPQITPPASASPISSPPVAMPTTPAKPKSSHPPLKSPMAGSFYRCPAPGAPPFVKVGDKVQKGQVVCIIEAMKLMNEIEADHSGTVVEILVDDGKAVSLDMPLLIIAP